MPSGTQSASVVIVGGGIAGLTAAALLGRAGREVVVYEKAHSLGGRATTQRKDTFQLNLGPHALYRGGRAMAILRELGISPAGGVPSASGGYAVAGGMKHALPGGLVSLLTTGLLRLPAKLELARLMARLPLVRTDALAATTVNDWIAQEIRYPEVRALLAALFRLSTYANAPDEMSAGAALAQLQLALRSNVLYLHGGWQTLVIALRAKAESAGARLVTQDHVQAIELAHDRVRICLPDREQSAAAVIVAVDPTTAAGLLPGASKLAAYARATRPIQAACLDVGLRALPQPRSTFALGVDRPLYLSVHSAVAQLAPAGQSLIHLAKYLPVGSSSENGAERELEQLLDLIQPGWRSLVVTRRFLPHLVVSNALVTAAGGGLPGRIAVDGAGIPGVLLAGDWVGNEGMLADASFASAQRAAQLALQTAVQGAAAA